MLLGAHVSIASGLSNAFKRGEILGCTAIQIFTKNQMRWRVKPLSDDEIDSFKNAKEISAIKSIQIHDSYLINLGSPGKNQLKRSRDAFSDEMQRASQLGIPYLVFHPGSHMQAGEKKGLQTIAESLNLVLEKQYDFELTLLLETTAGQGTNLGYHFEHLAEIIDMVDQKVKLGVCFDTAHVFAAGYDLRDEDSYSQTFSEFDKIIGLDKLKTFHLNDSKKKLGSRVDRHDNIGAGFLGEKAFQLLVNDPRFEDIPMILETPGGDEFFKQNLKLLQSLKTK